MSPGPWGLRGGSASPCVTDTLQVVEFCNQSQLRLVLINSYLMASLEQRWSDTYTYALGVTIVAEIVGGDYKVRYCTAPLHSWLFPLLPPCPSWARNVPSQIQKGKRPAAFSPKFFFLHFHFSALVYRPKCWGHFLPPPTSFQRHYLPHSPAYLWESTLPCSWSFLRRPSKKSKNRPQPFLFL